MKTQYRLSFLATFVFLSSIYTSDSGQVCGVCSRIMDPKDCNKVVHCGDHEKCVVMSYVSPDGFTLYDLSCMDAARCNNRKKRMTYNKDERQNGGLTCTMCCNDTQACNVVNGLCHSHPVNSSERLVCFNCDQMHHPNECNRITVCPRNLQCYLGKKFDYLSSQFEWESRCGFNQTECSTVLSNEPGYTEVGKRQSGNTHCLKCCKDSNLCNDDCSFSELEFSGGLRTNLTSPLGARQVLDCSVMGNVKSTVTWNKSNSCEQLIRNGTSLLINSTTFSDGGTYTCTAITSVATAYRKIYLRVDGNSECNFDQNDLCGWSNDQSNSNVSWLFHKGYTPSVDTGPSNDHTTGTDKGMYLYLEASGRTLYDNSLLKSPLLPAKTDTCLKFWYNMHGNDIGSLNVYTKTCKGAQHQILQLQGDKHDIWFETCLKVAPMDYEFNFLIEGVVGDGYQGDIAIDDIDLSTGINCVCKTDFNASCNFETGLCSWKQDETKDDFDWIVISGPTPSIDTGPSGDHTTGSGKYIYTEGSSPHSPGDKAILVSPSIEAGHSYCLEFAYHMHGAHMGTLNIYTESISGGTRLHNLYTLSGDKRNIWHTDHVTIQQEREPFSVVLEGIIGPDFSSDLAIDDIKLTPGSCSTA